MEIAETITLAMAILLIVGQVISLLGIDSKVTEARLALIVWLPMFTIMAITVVLLHVSPLHLIWLFVVSVTLSVFSLTLPWVERIALGIYLVLSFRNIIDELEEFEEFDEFEDEPNRSKLIATQPLFKGTKKEKPPGFG